MDPPQIQITQTAGAPAAVALSGEHDLSTSLDLDVAMCRAIDAGCGVIVDLTETTFIDSAILGVLIRAQAVAETLAKEGVSVVAPPSSEPAAPVRTCRC